METNNSLNTTAPLQQTNPPADLTFVKKQRLPTGPYSYYHETNALEDHYTYRNPDGTEFTTKKKLHGGKSKKYRKKRGKKTRKGRSKKYLRSSRHSR
jgi:hypothetical protein